MAGACKATINGGGGAKLTKILGSRVISKVFRLCVLDKKIGFLTL
jgi:hypothetical protein